jgi:hypothetical protein
MAGILRSVWRAPILVWTACESWRMAERRFPLTQKMDEVEFDYMRAISKCERLGDNDGALEMTAGLRECRECFKPKEGE